MQKKRQCDTKIMYVVGEHVTTSQKTAVSLLVSVILIAGFSVAAFSRLFALIEARFYQPVVVKGIEQRLEKISAEFTEYIYIHVSRFSAFASLRGIQNAFETTQSDEDIIQRADFSGTILNETAGLSGIRLVDSNGRRIHFSTFPDDVLRSSENEISYNNYTAHDGLDYEQVRALDAQEYHIFFDKQGNRLIFSFPVYDRRRAYRGSLIYYLDADSFGRYLAARNSINVTDYPRLAVKGAASDERQDPRARGFVFGAVGQMSGVLITEVESELRQNFNGIGRLAAVQDSVWVAVANSNSLFGSIVWVYPEDVFTLSLSVRIILLASIFITVFLIVFLIFSARRDPMNVIRHRIKRFQIAFIEDYFETKDRIEWDKLADEIAARKFDVSAEIRKSLGKPAVKHKEAVDALLEKSWDEILAVLGKKSEERQAAVGQTSTDEIKVILQQILSSGVIRVQAEPSAEHSVIRSVDQIEEFNEADVLGEVIELNHEKTVRDLDDCIEIEELSAADEIEDAVEIEELREADEIKDVIEIEKWSEAEEIIDELDEVKNYCETQELSKTNEIIEELVQIDTIEEIWQVEEDEQVLGSDDAPEEMLYDERLSDEFEANAETLDETEKIGPLVESETEPVRDSAPPAYLKNYDEDKEELRIGFPRETDTAQLDMNFEVFNPDFSFLDEIDEIAEDESENEFSNDMDAVCEAVELEARDAMLYSLFNAGAIFSAAETLDGEPDDVIVEDDGLYSIHQNVMLPGVAQDPEFKTLVDSVLK